MTQPTPTDPVELLPADGPGSQARLLPRVIALCIDWALCSLIAAALFKYRLSGGNGNEGFKPMAIFAVENLLLVSTIGTTVGHRIMGLVVTRVAGGPPGFVAGLIRTVLLMLAIPAVLSDSHGRGFHDKSAGTMILNAR